MLHVLSGQAEWLEKLEAAAAAGKPLSWIVPKKAIPGDEAVMFFPHLNEFVGHGEVSTEPTSTMFGGRHMYTANVTDFVVFAKRVPLKPIAAQYPAWGWPRASTKSLNTPPEDVQCGLLDALKRLAGAKAPPLPPVLEVLEALVRESRIMLRTRNRALRDEALRRSSGVCEGCGTDYSTILAGRGTCVLQVHHRNQLALNAVPVVTRLEDLAVVCANCHALIHADARHVVAVQELRSLLVKGRKHGA